ncbi:MAG: DNA polymerase III subunit beta [Gammaproteobacteria bacterium]|nr:DNA polymerase III subunit beta [Gammaproteobacteria bacterium]
MKFSAPREVLLKPLQSVVGVVERRQTMPVLANFLLVVGKDSLSVTATDLEVELMAEASVDVQQEGDITVPGRKFLDICKALPDGANITVSQSGERVIVRSGKSRFTLSTLPASEFPVVEGIGGQQTVEIEQAELRRLLEKTQFAMANQDVRYYLNGLLLELGKKQVRAVATDGHRLAMCDVQLEHGGNTDKQVIVPRKGVLELYRMLGEGPIRLVIGDNHVRAEFDGIRFTSKLIDGRFPEYQRVVPKKSDSLISADRVTLRQALQRTAILSNEKYRGIRLDVKKNNVIIQAHNPEQEEAEEELEVSYAGTELEIGFNVNYLLDALGAIDNDAVEIQVTDANSSCIIKDPENRECTYVVMPMRL